MKAQMVSTYKAPHGAECSECYEEIQRLDPVGYYHGVMMHPDCAQDAWDMES